MYILSFCSTGPCKIEEFHSYKIVIKQNDGNHSDFHLGMAVLGFKLRLPCYQVVVSLVFDISADMWKRRQQASINGSTCQTARCHDQERKICDVREFRVSSN
jgi:hypothetical protein